MIVKRTTSADPDFARLVTMLDAELAAEYGAVQNDYVAFNRFATDTAVVAYADDDAAGCGCFKRFDDGAIELKRMFVAPAHRGTGVGRAIVAALEAWARELGYGAAVLETGTRQAAALALYERLGYVRTPAYGQYVGMEFSVCMRKSLVPGRA